MKRAKEAEYRHKANPDDPPVSRPKQGPQGCFQGQII